MRYTHWCIYRNHRGFKAVVDSRTARKTALKSSTWSWLRKMVQTTRNSRALGKK